MLPTKGLTVLKLMQGFRDFIVRGNVVDLAVGIVIGAAFTGLVTSFTGSFIQPLLKVFSGGNDHFPGGQFSIHGVPFVWSGFVNALIAFLITAGVLYFFVITPMNIINERRRRGIEPAPKLPSDETKLLMEIRDLLAANGSPGQSTPANRSAPADQPQSKPGELAAKTASAAKTGPVAQRRGPGGTTRR
jgi:large conductance mechanosensitive channel